MKKFALIIFLGFRIIFEINALSSNINIGKTIIAGHVNLNDSSSTLISLSYSSITERCDYLTAIIDKNGDFKFEIDMLYPHDVLIKYERGMAKLIVHLNDSLFLRLDANEFTKEDFPLFEVAGRNAKTNYDIQKYLRLRQTNFNSECENKSVKQFLDDIRQNIKLQNSFLDSFIYNNDLSLEFINWAKKEIIYSNANYLMNFEYYHFVNKTNYEGDLFDNTLFPTDDDSALISSMYYTHLWHKAIFKYCKKDTVANELLNQGKILQAYKIAMNNIMIHENPGQSRDIMCYQLISYLLKEPKNDLAIMGIKPDLFLKNHILTEFLKKKEEENRLQSNYKVSFFDIVNNETQEIIGDFLYNIQNKHKGKVIFLDFWATWCGPCRAEVPYSIELQNYFKDKELVFINVCMSSNESDWNKMVKHLGGENYFLNNDQSALLRDRLEISGFPTYMIVDKVGHIVSRNAPRPSSVKEIKTLLTFLIQQ